MRVWIKSLRMYSPWGGGAMNLRELDLEDGVLGGRRKMKNTLALFLSLTCKNGKNEWKRERGLIKEREDVIDWSDGIG
jgi:hypothetical protein